MKSLLILLASVASFEAHADLVFEPYFYINYQCNWTEGANTEIAMHTDDVEMALMKAESLVGQQLVVTCVRAEYACVHDGDVEPRLIGKTKTDRSLKLIGGAIRHSETKQYVARVPGAGYHERLRLPPRCGY